MAKKNTKEALTEAYEDDFTQNPQAKSQADVEAQDTKTRLWQSLQQSYDQQRKQSNESYDQAIAQTDRSMIGRGMQRSSYLGQTLANMQAKKVEAENQITGDQIADFQNRLNTLEQQEKEDERWERQFQANREDTAWQQNFQQSEANRQQGNWEREYAANRADTTWSQNFQQSEAQRQQGNFEKEYAANRADTAWNQRFQQSEVERQQANADREFAANREDTAWSQQMQEKQFSFSQEQWEEQKAQWREQFDYNKKTTDQQIAYNYIMNMLEKGDSPSDALLKQAGISRKDYNQMKTAAKKTGSSRGSSNPNKNGGGNTPWEQLGMSESMYASLYPEKYKAYKESLNQKPDNDTTGEKNTGFFTYIANGNPVNDALKYKK